jgi:DNA polymerase I-like protein with 3'-5' exonuclease and polymerase domains
MELVAHLKNAEQDIKDKLVATFGSWWQAGPVTTPAADRNVKMTEWPDITKRRFSEKTGKELAPYVGPPIQSFSNDAPYTPIERITFNPGSRDHLGQRLQALYGWKPKAFGKNGKPTVDETTLEEIPEASVPKEVRQLLLDFFVVSKTLGMVSFGSKAWLHLITDRDRLHGRVDTAGAVTGRATHSNPNLGQCPAVRKEKVKQPDGSSTEVVLRMLAGRYGYECRDLFIADEGWELTGTDASSLELIDLGHYLVQYDEGAFRDRVCDPSRDPHTEHADLTGLTRADTKTATYLYIYGGSAYKLSLDISIDPEEVPQYLTYRGMPMLLKSLVRRFDQDFVDKLDDAQKAKIGKARTIILKFEGGIAGIKDLKENVTEAAKRGWLKGMDGRKLYVRKAHAALNTLLQAAGAQSCKLWMVILHRKLNEHGLAHGRDFKQVLWVHDELEFTHRPGLGPLILKLSNEAIREAGEKLGLRGAYRTDGRTGHSWAEVH